MEKLEREFTAFWQKEALADHGSHILAAVSGGADSVCLLSLLDRHRQKLGIRISVFHFNHCLRQTAERDENFVKALCGKMSLPFYARRKDVAAFARDRHLSIEEAARLLRYEAAEEVMKESGADLLATAHQQMDQAETLLFSLCRGTGLDGLGGIRPRRERVIRPLLFASREGIEGYLKSIHQEYMTDETNADVEFSRNLIRLRILPLLRQQINSASVEHMAEAAEKVRSAGAYIEESVKKAYQSVLILENEKETILSVSQMLALHPFLQSEILHLAISRTAGSSKDISAVHVSDTLSILQGQSGRRISLPYELIAERSFDELRIAAFGGLQRTEAEIQKQEPKDLPAEKGAFVSKQMLTENKGRMSLDGPGDYRISLRLMEADEARINEKNIPQKGYTKWLDYDKIDEHVAFRFYREGDYFYFDETRKKSAKAYFQDKKLPEREQRTMLLMAENSHVLVFFPERISYVCRLTRSTKRILEIKVDSRQ